MVIYRWRKAYKQRSLSGLEDNRGRLKKNMTKTDMKTNKQKPIEEFEREELTRLRKEINILKYKYYSKESFKSCY